VHGGLLNLPRLEDQIRRDEGVSNKRFPNGDRQVGAQPWLDDIAYGSR
jgi:hypothetical protein